LFKKRIKVNTSLLIGIAIYVAFISILYFRMKIMENMFTDYSNAQLCKVSFDCREIYFVKVLDYGSSRISFQNYGSKGIPLDSGTFEEYVFVISGEVMDKTNVKILPEIRVDMNKFDVENVYLPSSFDKTITSDDFLDGKNVSVEIWRNDITFIFINPISDNNEPISETISIVPSKQVEYEMVLPTEKHPLIRFELAKRDFNGWGVGVLFMILSVIIFGGTVSGLFLGLSWLIQRIRSLWRKK
jgi:hypothetical protein